MSTTPGPQHVTELSAPGSRPLRAGRVQTNDLPDGVALFDPVANIAHHLNPVATLVWELIDGRTTREIVVGVGVALEIDGAEAEQVTRTALSQFAHIRVLE